MAIEDSKGENVPGNAHNRMAFHLRKNPVSKGSEIADERWKMAEKAGARYYKRCYSSFSETLANIC